jgi:2-methylcitrate dehydratase PrpD
VGFNAKSALGSIDLTMAGFPGLKGVFNGEHGYFNLIENNQFDMGYMKNNIGKQWMINEIAHKPYPSGRLTHGLVHAIKDLKLKYKLNKDDIKAIICHVPPGVYKLVSRPVIENLTTNYAKLCARFVGASYMINDHLNIDTFTDKKYLNNKETLKFADKIKIIKNDDLNEKVLTPQLFNITLANNKHIEIKLDNVYGHPKVPLSEKEYLNKFEVCCASSVKKIDKLKINEMMDFLLDIENKDNVIDFFKII